MKFAQTKILMIISLLSLINGCSNEQGAEFNSHENWDKNHSSNLSPSEADDNLIQKGIYLNDSSDTESQIISSDSAKILSITNYGSGCRNDSASAIISTDQKSFSVFFSEFFVEAEGSKRKVSKKKRRCRLKIKVHVPKGSSLNSIVTQTRGNTYLEEGAKLVSKATYKKKPRSYNKRLYRSKVVGPFDDDQIFDGEVTRIKRKWSNRRKRIKTIYIDTFIYLKVKKESFGESYIDTIDGVLN